MIQLAFDNKALEQENKDLKEKYNTLINKLQVQENDQNRFYSNRITNT